MPNLHLSPFKISASVVTLILVIFAYYNFSAYRPKILKQVSETKGYSTQDPLFNLPYMTGATEVGISSTNKGRQITLEIDKTPEVVRNFYKNIFADKGWKITTSSKNANSLVDVYIFEGYKATVVISKEDAISKTVIGINITSGN